MNKLISRIGIIVGLFLAITCIQKFLIQEQPIQFNSYINQQEHKMWQSFEQQGINRADFYALKKQKAVKDVAKPAQQKVCPEVKQLFYSIARDFDLNPKTVTIQTVYEGDCAAWVDSKTMIINEPTFLQLPKKAQRFVVAHELQHIIHDDHEDRYIFGDVLENAHIDKEVATRLEQQFYRFQEERADIKAALKHIDYAHDYVCCMQDFLKTYGDTDNPEHPTLSYRLKLAQNIVGDMDRKTLG